MHPFFSVRDELTIQLQDGLIFRGQREVVPQSLRPLEKTKLHSSHMGIDARLRRARESVFWPGFSAEIKQMIETCETCRKFETSPPKEPLASHDVPLRPWTEWQRVPNNRRLLQQFLGDRQTSHKRKGNHTNR